MDVLFKYLPRFPLNSNYQQPHSLARSFIALSTAWRSNLFYLFLSWLLWFSFNSPSSHTEETVMSQSLFIVSIYDFVRPHHILCMPTFLAEKSLPSKSTYHSLHESYLNYFCCSSQLFPVEVKPSHEGNRTAHKIQGATEPWIYCIVISSMLFSSFPATSQGLTVF